MNLRAILSSIALITDIRKSYSAVEPIPMNELAISSRAGGLDPRAVAKLLITVRISSRCFLFQRSACSGARRTKTFA